MIHKHRPIPLIVHFGHALIPRLNPNHPKISYIEKDIRKFMSGYRGEMATDYYTQFLDDKNHHIFRGLRLPHEQNYFQIDNPVLSRKFILLLESKNLPGEVNVSEDQFSQSSNYGEKGYTNPIIQVNRHKEQLQNWLESHKLPQVPIIPLVVLTHPTAVINYKDPAILQKICKVDNVKNKILSLTQNYTNDMLSPKEVKKITMHLLEDDTPIHPNMQNKYGILPGDVIPGVRCSNCSCNKMVRKDRIWVCPRCLFYSQTAHRDGLLDYFLLKKPTITNKEFRAFFGIESIKTANNMLNALNLPASGNNKGRVYHRPDDFLDQLEERYKNQG